MLVRILLFKVASTGSGSLVSPYPIQRRLLRKKQVILPEQCWTNKMAHKEEKHATQNQRKFRGWPAESFKKAKTCIGYHVAFGALFTLTHSSMVSSLLNDFIQLLWLEVEAFIQLMIAPEVALVRVSGVTPWLSNFFYKIVALDRL